MQICTSCTHGAPHVYLQQQCHSSCFRSFAAACLEGGRNGIVFYTDPEIGAMATGSLAEYLHVEELDEEEGEIAKEVEK